MTDVVPTICYLMDWPVPAQCEGNVLYQALENPNVPSDRIARLKESLLKLEEQLSKGSH